jgi:hypothetical protein
MLEPPKNLLRPVVSDIHRRSFVFVDIYRSKSECIIKLINVRSFTKAFGICRHSPANVDIHYFRTLTVTYTSINIFLWLQTLCRITEKYEFLLKYVISCSDGALIGRCVPSVTPTIAVDVLNGCWSVARRGQFTLW